MKLSQIIPFSLSVALFIIGVHQTFTVGIAESYWIFMLSIGFLLIYQLKKDKPASGTMPDPTADRAKEGLKKPKTAGAKQSGKPGRSKPNYKNR